MTNDNERHSGYEGRSPYDSSPYADGSGHAFRRPGASRPQGGSPYDAPAGRRRQGRGSDAAVETPVREDPRAAGVRPVTKADYRHGNLGYSYAPQGKNGGRGGVSRRSAIVAGAVAAGAVALTGAGVTWWNHRAVACEVNGTQRAVKIGATVQEIIDKGFASPRYGNLVSIPDATGNVSVLEQGAGNRYTVSVNGQDVDPDTYRLEANDKVVFTDGTDKTEESTKQVTSIPCGVVFRKGDGTLMDPNEATNAGLYLAPLGYVAQWGRDGESTVETGAVSGVTVDRGVTTQAQDLIVAVNGVNPVGNKPMVALTFDDGPEPTFTPQYLDILAQYGVKATFFNLGKNAEAYPELTQRVVSEGHQLANHTYSHQDLVSIDAASMESEVEQGFATLQSVVGVTTGYLRPPYGNFYVKQFLQTLGKVTCSVYWGVDSDDWMAASQEFNTGVNTILSNVTGQLSGNNFNGAIILMHDGGGERSRDVAALPTIIETFLNAGYDLVTLKDMLQADPAFPEWVWSDQPAVPADATIPDLSAYIA